ncbi:tripartite-type tricarboxylate transporter receptor subunit TctC [Hydrogenophaga palleronii]|uniref:Tripartite-type tricarboxylate transporter receptor subunit TctC n=1 Tax=Hydrogenophaga palleronii TaxID=65655 RepID=A0ABU1WJ90_9BURK|nr:tripartite tricarboxylate transporter substrate binding protein [Hydrogenophaga palleronii]MDR7149137.1 tripartite-type tricarboxylate transporter receptor subunit TctC [Hydrogenophaga palleronii]
MQFTLLRRSLLACAALTVLGLSVAHAQSDWPNRVVKIIVPYAPGGAVDVVTRKMAQKLSEQTGQSFIVENKAGATGTIGTNQVAQSAGDGYTLLANDTTYSLLPHIFKKLPFDHATQLVPVGAYVFAPMGLVVNAQSPHKTLADLTTKAKSAPDTVSYGTGGPGTTPHFASEALGIAAGVKFMHVPFKGAAEATVGVLSNAIEFQIASTTGLMSNVQGGRMRMLAVSGDQRLPALPDVPTFKESNIGWSGVVNWTGLWAPKGTPVEVLERLHKEIEKAMASEDMKSFAVGMGAEARQVTGPAFATILKDSTDSWGKVVANTAFEKR